MLQWYRRASTRRGGCRTSPPTWATRTSSRRSSTSTSLRSCCSRRASATGGVALRATRSETAMTPRTAHLLAPRLLPRMARAQRNCSRHTILSYRDTWRLYLRYVAARRQPLGERAQARRLTAEEVLAFLKHLETERHDTIGTRNCRLAAIRSFYRFVADREPLAAAQCAAVLRIPMKKTRDRRSATSTARRSTRSCASRIDRRSKGSAIKRCWRSCTTPVRASRRP